MQITPIRTRILVPPRDDFFSALCESLDTLPDGTVVVLSSKAVAIGEGRCVPIPQGDDARVFKDMLIRSEADYYAETEEARIFTITRGSFTSGAGIDESNGNGHYILWPRNPQESAEWYRAKLIERYGCKSLGVIITDSRSTPLHNGAIGMAIAHAGFAPLKDYRASNDVFGRAFKFERLNIADSIAASANLVMGEGNEMTPVALCSDIPHNIFTQPISTDPHLAHIVSKEEDIFHTVLDTMKWTKGGGGYIIES